MATIVEVSEPAVAQPPRFTYLEWSPVIAGALGAAALSLLFLTFGSALGLSVVSPYPYSGLNPTTFLIVVALFASLVHVASFAAGGYLAGRMRTPWPAGVESERHFRDGTYGFAVWALGLLLGAGLAMSGAGGVLSSAMHATTTVAASGATMMSANRVSMAPSDVAIDLLLRPAPGQAMAAATPAPTTAAPVPAAVPPAQTATQPDSAPATDPKPAAPATSSSGMPMKIMHSEMRDEHRGELQAPLARVFVASLRDGTMTPRDRTYLAEIVARQTGLPQAEAEKRVDEVYAEAKTAEQKVRAAADRARKLGAIAAFLAAATLAVACAAACIAASVGGRHRDEETPARMFGARRFW